MSLAAQTFSVTDPSHEALRCEVLVVDGFAPRATIGSPLRRFDYFLSEPKPQTGGVFASPLHRDVVRRTSSPAWPLDTRVAP